MALKRKASSTSIQDSPSKRTRSKVAPSTPSIATGSPRKSRAAKPSVPANDLSDDSSDDELNIIDQEVPPTPSKRSKRQVHVVIPTPNSSRRPAFPKPKAVQFADVLPLESQPSPSKKARSTNYGKQRAEDRAAHQLLQAKVVQLKTPSLTPPPAIPPPIHVPSPQRSPSRHTAKENLSHHLCESLTFQKRAVLRALQHPPVIESEDDSERSTNEIAMEKLSELLDGTVTRGEGNSCLLLGPRGSGKTQTIELCISNLKETPVVIRLSGLVQTNDRLAMRELSRQLSSQVSPALLPEEIRGAANDESLEDDDDNPFLDTPAEAVELSVPTAHMHSLIACIPTLGRPTIVILDAFDLFTDHPRQSFLYSLLDTVQSCRAGGRNNGFAVVGVTSRMDTLMALEKRVKSRFSGRMIRTSASIKASQAKNITRALLTPSLEDYKVDEEFSDMWNASVDDFLADPRTTRILEEACSITGDIRSLARLFVSPVLNLKPVSPWLTASQLELSAETQRIRPEFAYLHTLNYPSLCLLLAFYQADSDGYPALTFEMLYEYVRNAIRVSAVAPVQLRGNSIGMVRCSRQVLLAAFEHLISAQIFVSLSGPSVNAGKNFLKYRCSVDREDVKKSVERNGHSSLTKFLRRAMGSR
ncbi:origin recognition complex subunit 4 C-terminus-domain-containing protein [Lentinula edodes]|uniref:Origin recognition complex subunit 4 C-terminus-domain-containing protein n=1 Tax=Lentinula lateritia TaxID=40482 RepID=A0A9W9AFI4_9AGAR|nr:origin recognition complex subunit 4 C-terminus-domain-containing protein [Lentinula edodes]